MYIILVGTIVDVAEDVPKNENFWHNLLINMKQNETLKPKKSQVNSERIRQKERFINPN